MTTSIFSSRSSSFSRAPLACGGRLLTTTGSNYAKLTVDDAGGVHIVVRTGGDQRVKYNYKVAGGDWVMTETLGDWTDNYYPDVTTTSTDAHVVLRTDTAILRAEFAPLGSSGSWVSAYIDTSPTSSNMGGDVAVASHTDDTVYAVYADGDTGTAVPNQLRMSTRTPGGSWSSQYVDTGGLTSSGTGASIDLDPLGGIHIAHGGEEGLYYTTRPAGSSVWSTSPIGIDPDAYTASIAADGFGDVHVLYRDATNSDLWLTTKPAGEVWAAPEQVATGVGASFEIIADPDGHLHVAYRIGTTLLSGTKLRCP